MKWSFLRQESENAAKMTSQPPTSTTAFCETAKNRERIGEIADCTDHVRDDLSARLISTCCFYLEKKYARARLKRRAAVYGIEGRFGCTGSKEGPVLVWQVKNAMKMARVSFHSPTPGGGVSAIDLFSPFAAVLLFLLLAVVMLKHPLLVK